MLARAQINGLDLYCGHCRQPRHPQAAVLMMRGRKTHSIPQVCFNMRRGCRTPIQKLAKLENWKVSVISNIGWAILRSGNLL